ncbi:MAG: DUF4315 family protein [Lachnospiraceae bacterium]|nr:DUF4315 family protein [Lachnospiraceae bacterium]
MKIERIRTELDKARRKAAEWQARAKDLERQLTEQENLEIIQAVRSITASPEELGDILGRIRSMKLCAEPLAETVSEKIPEETAEAAETPQEPQNNNIEKETDQNEKETL